MQKRVWESTLSSVFVLPALHTERHDRSAVVDAPPQHGESLPAESLYLGGRFYYLALSKKKHLVSLIGLPPLIGLFCLTHSRYQ